jgi:hypothetical protein
MNEDSPYYKTWYSYWKWRKESGKRVKKRVLITLVLFFPVLYLIVRPLYILFAKDWIIHLYALLWFITLFLCFLPGKRTSLICPRCGKHFFQAEGWEILNIGIHVLLGIRRYHPLPITYQCAHCGLDMPVIKISDKERTA